ncbi:DUF1427 family protein [Amycolatopsis japonica]
MDYLVSFGVGTFIGALYATLHIRSPAPPPPALLGLFAIGTTYSLLETLI